MRSGTVRTLVAFCIVSAVGLGWVSGNAQASNLVDIGVATGYGINNNGQVALDVGIYSNGTITPLPVLSGPSTRTSALAINATGQVAGSAIAPASGGNGPTSVPIAYARGILTNISALLPIYGGRMIFDPGAGTGINSSGQVVGWYVDLLDIHGHRIAFTFSNGIETDMAPFPCIGSGNCAFVYGNKPYGVNDRGQITGAVDYATSNSPPGGESIDAYIYSSGSWTDIGPGAGYAINGAGQVTGTLTTATGTNAFIYSNGATTNLGTLPGGAHSTGYAINATGQIVGASDFTSNSTTRAFFYNGVITDLNAFVNATDPLQPFVILTSARGINDARLIVANGVDSRTNQTHAYLLQAPWMEIAPGVLTFGAEAVGGTSALQSVVITNSGAMPVVLGAVTTSSNFSQTNNCSTSLAPSSHCTIMVAFAPTVAGALTGGLTVASEGTSYAVPLSGVAPIAATISASSSTATVGTSVTITWASSPGSTCVAADSSLNASFNGTIPPSGSRVLTEIAAGTFNYGTHCTAAGTPEVDPATSIVWTWPAVTATLSASPTTITAGQATTLTWKSSNATGCSASGGASGDGWAGDKMTSGSQTVSEPFLPATPSVTLTFGIKCTSAPSGLSAQASANVVDNSPPVPKSGGGALDLWSVFVLLSICVLQSRAAPLE